MLGTGLWLLFRRCSAGAIRKSPARVLAQSPLSVRCSCSTSAVARLEVYAMYGLFVAVLYAFMAGAPFGISGSHYSIFCSRSRCRARSKSGSARVLFQLPCVGFPIASAGSDDQIGRKQLLVAAACAGLNSLITLTALAFISMFYLSHQADWRYMAVLTSGDPGRDLLEPRCVLLLILITCYGK